MSQQPHICVIGAGMGGLAAALELAKQPVRVTLLESATTAGGKMREVSVDGTAIDSGPTVFTMRWIFDELLAGAPRGLDEIVDLRKAERLARHYWTDGSSLDLFADLDATHAAISAFSTTSEADRYLRFAAEAERIFETLDRTFMRATRPNAATLTRRVGLRNLGSLLATRPFQTYANYLRARFEDPRLQQLFGRYATYCGSSPYEAPATLALIAEAERRGVHYVEGGMQRLAEALVAELDSMGVTIHFDCHVSEVTRGRKDKFHVKAPRGGELSVDAVIFNGDTEALVSGQLGSAWQRSVAPRPVERFSLSALTWSGHAEVTGAALDHHTVLFSADYAEEFLDLRKHRRLPQHPTVYVCAPSANASPTKRQNVFLLINAPPRSLSAAEVESAEFAISQTLDQCGIQLHNKRWQITRPQDFAARFPGSAGGLYGQNTHGPWGSLARQGARTRERGFYLAGGSVHPGAGIPMASQSGRLAASAVLHDLGLKQRR